MVGASGSGKDTLLSHVREGINYKHIPVIFAHRYITRQIELSGENHICLSEQEFLFRLSKGLFAMHWQSHGNYYGIGFEINQWLSSGSLVVINGSRGYIPQALALYPEMQICQIQTNPEKLRERLLKRGRESEEDIEERLQRASEFNILLPGIININNDGTIDETKKYFIRVLSDLLKIESEVKELNVELKC